jgi:hypothetical protein
VARWDGAAWSALGVGMNTTVFALTTLPNGDLVAGGNFTNVGNRVARWNGTSWSPLDSGVPSTVYALATTPSGDLVLGGSFLTAGTNVSAYLARLASTCPATAVPFGAGCAGSGGPNVLHATALPWIGSTFRAEASGMPALGFVAAVTGFTQVSIPLSLALYEALPGCQGLVSADAVDVLLPSAGKVQTQLAIPANAALVGLQVHQYVVAFELNGLGQVAAITSSNALTLQVGSY